MFLGDDLKKKWKNVRDSYAKHLRSEKTTTGQAIKKVDRYKTWPWAQQMSFFKYFLKFADTESNISLPDDAQENDPAQAEDRAKDQTTVQMETPPPKKKICRTVSARTKEETGQSSVDKVVSYLQSKKLGQSEHDEIDMVFLGYAKTIKKFTNKRQIITKFRVAKILMEEELKNMEEQTTTATHFTSSCSSYPSASSPAYSTSENFGSVYSPPTQHTEESQISDTSATNWYENFGQNANI